MSFCQFLWRNGCKQKVIFLVMGILLFLCSFLDDCLSEFQIFTLNHCKIGLLFCWSPHNTKIEAESEVGFFFVLMLAMSLGTYT